MLERKASSSSLVVRVIPGPGLNCWAIPAQKTALLKLYDQDQGLVVDEWALISLYGLTRSEASFAARIMQGKSIEEAASELFISAHRANSSKTYLHEDGYSSAVPLQGLSPRQPAESFEPYPPMSSFSAFCSMCYPTDSTAFATTASSVIATDKKNCNAAANS